MSHPLRYDPDDPMLAKVRQIAFEFPGADEKISHGRPAFFTKKIFVMYSGSLKIDGEWIEHSQSIVFLPDPEEKPALVADPRCWVPAYWGPYGWLGWDIDAAADFEEVTELIEVSFRLTAGKRLISELDQREMES